MSRCTLSIVAAALVSLAAASQANPLFRSAFLVHETGDFPYGVAAGDLNHDGRPDLVVPHEAELTVGVLLAQGGGLFAPRADYATAGQSYSGALGDLNEDGHLDVVLACWSANAVSVLSGVGDGTLGARTDFAVGSTPRYVLVSDLNGDTHLDVVTANYGSNDVSVLLGDGTGALAPHVDYAAVPHANMLAIANVTGSLARDLVVSSLDGSSLAVLRGLGDGTFAPPGLEPISARSVALLDADGDAHVDAVVTVAGGVRLLRGRGDGTFALGGLWPVGGRYAVGTDLDGDGHADLVAVDGAFDGGLDVLPGDGTGAFGPVVHYRTGSQPQFVIVTEVNGDTLLDLAVANRLSNTITLHPGNGDGTFGVDGRVATGTGPVSASAGDLDGDGLLDVVVATRGAPATSVLRGVGGAALVPAGTVPAAPGSSAVALLHADGDSRLDMALANLAAGTVAVRPGNGDATFGAASDISVGGAPAAMAVADLNGDGRSDLVLADTTDFVRVAPGNGDGTFGPVAVYASGAHCNTVAVGDVNGDSLPDVVAASDGRSPFYVRALTVRLGTGGGALGPRVDLPAGSARPRSVAIAHLNGDEHLDLVAAGGRVVVLAGNGDGTFGPPADVGTIVDALAVAAADVNADGAMDLIVSRIVSPGTSGAVTMLVGDGLGAFTPRESHGVAVDPRAIVVRDLDGDSRPDIVAVNAGSNDVTVLRNTGGAAWSGVPDRDLPPGPRWVWVRPVPARGEVTVEFRLATGAWTSVRVLDAAGRVVRRLAAGERRAGVHALNWDTRADTGARVPPGLYWVEVRAGEVRGVTRAVVVR